VEARAGKGRNRALSSKVARATKAARVARAERVGVSLGEEEAEVAKAASTAAIVAAREAAEAVAKAGMRHRHLPSHRQLLK
jgi:hypothetical protein